MKSPQLILLKKEKLAFGGELMKKRAGRVGHRPLDTKNSMHLVLRSSKAKGTWSFKHGKNRKKISAIVQQFSRKYGVKVHSLANVGNHLHFHIHLSNRHAYKPFIRAITASIAMAVTGTNRWTRQGRQAFEAADHESAKSLRHDAINRHAGGSKKANRVTVPGGRLRFWDYRPFTRVIAGGLRTFLAVRDYVRINQLEGFGFTRAVAKLIVRDELVFSSA